ATLMILLASFLAALVWKDSGAPARCLELLVLPYGVLLCSYYGLLFGAHHFMSRYLAPLGPFLALWTFAVLWRLWRTRFGERSVTAISVLAVLLAIAVFSDARKYLGGDKHQHFQVKEWVEKNVPSDAWVGAIQSGTVGFFHERTINLDGKVNPAA